MSFCVQGLKLLKKKTKKNKFRFIGTLSVGLITSRHYLSEKNKNGGTGDEQKANNSK